MERNRLVSQSSQPKEIINSEEIRNSNQLIENTKLTLTTGTQTWPDLGITVWTQTESHFKDENKAVQLFVRPKSPNSDEENELFHNGNSIDEFFNSIKTISGIREKAKRQFLQRKRNNQKTRNAAVKVNMALEYLVLTIIFEDSAILEIV